MNGRRFLNRLEIQMREGAGLPTFPTLRAVFDCLTRLRKRLLQPRQFIVPTLRKIELQELRSHRESGVFATIANIRSSAADASTRLTVAAGICFAGMSTTAVLAATAQFSAAAMRLRRIARSLTSSVIGRVDDGSCLRGETSEIL